MRKNCLLALNFILVSCGSVNYFKTSEKSYTPKEKNCDFKILTRAPQKAYEEIGAINLTAGFGGGKWANNLKSFKSTVSSKVCESGGDAIIATMNGYSYYIGGTIIKY